MAITSVIPIAGGRRPTINERGVRTYSRRYRVLSSILGENEIAVLLATGIPRLFDSDPNDPGAYVRDISAEEDEANGFRWIVTVEYSSQAREAPGAEAVNPATGQRNPLAEPAIVEWDDVEIRVPVTTDLEGVAIVNAAGQPFDPPPEVEEGITVCRIIRNEAGFDPDVIDDYKLTVSLHPFFGRLGRQCLMRKITARQQNGEGFRYDQVTYEIHIAKLKDDPSSPDGKNHPWQLKLLNAGLCEKVSGKLKPIRDKDGTPINQPAPLNTNGTAIANLDTTPPNYKDFTVKGTVNWRPLQLPEG